MAVFTCGALSDKKLKLPRRLCCPGALGSWILVYGMFAVSLFVVTLTFIRSHEAGLSLSFPHSILGSLAPSLPSSATGIVSP